MKRIFRASLCCSLFFSALAYAVDSASIGGFTPQIMAPSGFMLEHGYVQANGSLTIPVTGRCPTGVSPNLMLSFQDSNRNPHPVTNYVNTLILYSNVNPYVIKGDAYQKDTNDHSYLGVVWEVWCGK